MAVQAPDPESDQPTTLSLVGELFLPALGLYLRPNLRHRVAAGVRRHVYSVRIRPGGSESSYRPARSDRPIGTNPLIFAVCGAGTPDFSSCWQSGRVQEWVDQGSDPRRPARPGGKVSATRSTPA